MVDFTPSATYDNVFNDASFSTAWSPDGLKYAVASQSGCVKVWDVRSSKPMAEYWGLEARRRMRVSVPAPAPVPIVRTSARPIPMSRRRSSSPVPGLDPPLADGSQFMSLSSSLPLPSAYSPYSHRGVPATSSSFYYGFNDGGGQFGTFSGTSSNLNMPNQEMDLVVPSVRSLKFIKSGGRDVLAFSEVCILVPVFLS